MYCITNEKYFFKSISIYKSQEMNCPRACDLSYTANGLRVVVRVKKPYSRHYSQSVSSDASFTMQTYTYQEDDFSKWPETRLAHLKLVAREYRGKLNLIPLAPKGNK